MKKLYKPSRNTILACGTAWRIGPKITSSKTVSSTFCPKIYARILTTRHLAAIANSQEMSFQLPFAAESTFSLPFDYHPPTTARPSTVQNMTTPFFITLRTKTGLATCLFFHVGPLSTHHPRHPIRLQCPTPSYNALSLSMYPTTDPFLIKNSRTTRTSSFIFRLFLICA